MPESSQNNNYLANNNIRNRGRRGDISSVNSNHKTDNGTGAAATFDDVMPADDDNGERRKVSLNANTDKMATAAARHYEDGAETLGALLARRNDILQHLQYKCESQMALNFKPTAAAKSVNRSTQIEVDDPLLRRELESLDQQIACLKYRLDRSNAPRQNAHGYPHAESGTSARQVHLSLNRLSTPGDERAPTVDPNTASMTSFGSSTEAGVGLGLTPGTAGAAAPQGGNHEPHQGGGGGGEDQGEQMYFLLSMLSSQDRLESARTLALMSNAADTCELMWRSGCDRLLIQLLHPGDGHAGVTDQHLEVATVAAEALKKLVSHSTDADVCQKGQKVLRQLERVRGRAMRLRRFANAEPFQHDTANAVSFLMQGSFDDKYRRVIGMLGGLLALAELLIVDQEAITAAATPDVDCALTAMRCHVGMALTNLTFGNPANKQQLCAFPGFLRVVNHYVASRNEELVQVFASVVRNLSWKADAASKDALRQAGVVGVLTCAAIAAQKESTLKSTLSAVWNLSSHSTENKAEICATPDALPFLVSTLNYKASGTASTPSMTVVENGGGVLRNVSSQIALNDAYRAQLRRAACYKALLRHLQSPSLTVVSNACGTLWNLSARNADDQRLLWDLGAVPMLKNLVSSRHRMISLASTAALKNLYSCQTTTVPANNRQPETPGSGSVIGEVGSGSLMSHRRRKAFEEQLDSVCRLISPPPQIEDDGGVSPGGFSSVATRRVTPKKEIMALVGDVVTATSSQKCATARLRSSSTAAGGRQLASSVPPTGQMTQHELSPSHRRKSSLQRPVACSKEEKILQDKAAVQRYHNSLKRSANRWREKKDVEQQDEVHDFGFDHSNENVAARARSKSNSASAFPAQDTNSVMTQDHEQSRHEDEQRQMDAYGVDSATNQTTPLMASRHSSVESLSSGDQHSICSERNSVVNSNVPTGIVSPSELPDSPGMISPFRFAHETTKLSDRSDGSATKPAATGHDHHSNADSPISGFSALTLEDNRRIRTGLRAEEHNGNSSNATALDDRTPCAGGDADESEYGEFFGRQSDSHLLDTSIRSAIPSPRNGGPQRRRRHSGNVSKSSIGGAGGLNLTGGAANESGSGGVADYSYGLAPADEQLNVTRNVSASNPVVFDLPPPLSADSSGLVSRNDETAPQSTTAAADVSDFIRSAMPKPGDRCRHKGKPIAAAIPMVRQQPPPPTTDTRPQFVDKSSSNGDNTASDVPVLPPSSTNATSSSNPVHDRPRSMSPSTVGRRTTNNIDDNEDAGLVQLNLAIDAVLPKRADARTPTRRFRPLPGASLAGDGGSSTLERLKKKQKTSPKHVIGSGQQSSYGDGGILEASGASVLLMQSGGSSYLAGLGNSLLFGASVMGGSDWSTTAEANNIDGVAPPDRLMQASSCSSVGAGRLLADGANHELVRDASSLLGGVQPAVKMIPSANCALPDCLTTTTAAQIFAKQSSGGTTDGSLSEDNYSRGDDDDNFDIAPEDIDLRLVEEDANQVVTRLESVGMCDSNNTHSSEIVIDCETLSLVSNSSHLAASAIDDCPPPPAETTLVEDPPGAVGGTPPKILSATDVQQRTPPKALKGGGGKRGASAAKRGANSATPSPPKVVVRTTKAAQLRAKKTNESSGDATAAAVARGVSLSPRPSPFLRGDGAASSSASSADDKKTTPSGRNSGRQQRSRLSPLSKAAGGDPKTTTVGSVGNGRQRTGGETANASVRRQQPPPIAPKPKAVASSMHKPSQAVLPSARAFVSSTAAGVASSARTPADKTSPSVSPKEKIIPPRTTSMTQVATHQSTTDKNNFAQNEKVSPPPTANPEEPEPSSKAIVGSSKRMLVTTV